MGQGRRKLTVEKAAKALRQESGVVKYAAAALGVHRWTLFKFIQENPELNEVRDGAVEEFLDDCERKMMTAVDTGDMQTVRWALERLGKSRGYSTRVESTGANGERLAVSHIARVIVDPCSGRPERDDHS
jgi:acyl-CoA thioesterase FadM